MRWESDELINRLYEILGGYEMTTDSTGQPRYIRRNKDVLPMINDHGLDTIAGIVRSTVNPVVSLSNVEIDYANELVRQTLYTVSETLLRNQSEYGINDGNIDIIYSHIKTLVFMQVMRAVNGHESKNFRTQTLEQNVTQNTNKPAQGGGILGMLGIKR
jgi:hypothetical protein